MAEPPSIHVLFIDKVQLAQSYAEDGAFFTAARVLKEMGDALEQHAKACEADERAATRPPVKLTLAQSLALGDASKHGLRKWHRGWTGNGVNIISSRTVLRLIERGLVEHDGELVRCTPEGSGVVLDLYGKLP